MPLRMPMRIPIPAAGADEAVAVGPRVGAGWPGAGGAALQAARSTSRLNPSNRNRFIVDLTCHDQRCAEATDCRVQDAFAVVVTLGCAPWRLTVE